MRNDEVNNLRPKHDLRRDDQEIRADQRQRHEAAQRKIESEIKFVKELAVKGRKTYERMMEASGRRGGNPHIPLENYISPSKQPLAEYWEEVNLGDVGLDGNSQHIINVLRLTLDGSKFLDIKNQYKSDPGNVYFINLYNPRAGMIIAKQIHSRDTRNGNLIAHWSDVAFPVWVSICTQQGVEDSALQYVVQNTVTNKNTSLVIDRIMPDEKDHFSFTPSLIAQDGITPIDRAGEGDITEEDKFYGTYHVLQEVSVSM